MILLLALGQLLDGLTFAYVALVDPRLLDYEQSPFTLALYAAGGVAMVLLVKAALVLAVLTADRMSRSGLRDHKWRILIGLVALSGFVGAACNLWSVTHA